MGSSGGRSCGSDYCARRSSVAVRRAAQQPADWISLCRWSAVSRTLGLAVCTSFHARCDRIIERAESKTDGLTAWWRLFAFGDVRSRVGRLRQWAQMGLRKNVPHLADAGEPSLSPAELVERHPWLPVVQLPSGSSFHGKYRFVALGGVSGSSPLFVRQELLLAIVGGALVIETLSVILQIASHRCSGGEFFAAPVAPSFSIARLGRE